MSISVKNIFFIILLVIVLFFGYGAFKKQRSGGGILVVGSQSGYHPFSFSNDKGEVVGFDIDFATALSKQLGMLVKLEISDFNQLQKMLLDKKISLIVSAFSESSDRAKTIAFSVPYYRARLAAVMLRGATYKTLEEMGVGDSKKAAVLSGTTIEMFVDEYIKVARSNIQSIPVASEDGMISKLKAGEVEVVLLEEARAKEVCANGEYSYFVIDNSPVEYRGSYVVGARKEDADLIKRINVAIHNMRDSGELDKLLAKWNLLIK